MINEMAARQLQQDRQNAVVARPTDNATGSSRELYLGKITMVNENGTYAVALIGEGGTDKFTIAGAGPQGEDLDQPIQSFDGIFAPGAAASYAVGNTVYLRFASNQQPEIMTSGGGGSSSCQMAINAFGVLWGGNE